MKKPDSNNNISINLLNFIINNNINRNIINRGNYIENIHGNYIENSEYHNPSILYRNDFVWEILPCILSPFSKSSQLIKTIYEDIIYQFQNSPLKCNQAVILSEKSCSSVFPKLSNRLQIDKHLDLNQYAWAGEQDNNIRLALKDHPNPIKISVHTMMVSAIITLLSLKYRLGIPIEINWQSGCSPEQINNIAIMAKNNKIFDFILTADAGMHYSSKKISSEYRRLFTCVQESQYILGTKKAQDYGISSVFVTRGTTQQIHHELWSSENRLPKHKTELHSISDIPNILENISSREVIILTRQKSRRFLCPQLIKLDEEKRGLSFSLYHHISELDHPLHLQQFITAFITEWNYCKTLFLNSKIIPWSLNKTLAKMLFNKNFLNAYSIASDFEILYSNMMLN